MSETAAERDPPGNESVGVPADPDVAWGATPPAPLGDAASNQTVGEVAAPLLAGFSIALIGVVAQNPEALRWPGASLALLVVAAVLLLATVQLAFRARQHYWTKPDAGAWFPDGELPTGLDESYRQMHVRHLKVWRRSRELMRNAYNGGISVLAFGVAVVVSPPLAYGTEAVTGPEQVLRWFAAAVAAVGGVAEIVLWMRTGNDDGSGR